MICRVTDHNSQEYWQAVELRRQVLRFPLGLDFTDQQLAEETDTVHFIGEVDGIVLATALATPIDKETIKIRQVAVSQSQQGKGYGRDVMLFAEDWAAKQGFNVAVLNARATVVDFYLKLSYELFDEPFEEVGIPHRKMRKPIGG
jgi:predicted GNAT family N-acyltransferase